MLSRLSHQKNQTIKAIQTIATVKQSPMQSVNVLGKYNNQSVLIQSISQ